MEALSYNSTNRTLTFNLTGSDGTTGFVNVTIGKTLVKDASDIKVYLDGEQLSYELISTNGAWLLHFTYEHSTHSVNIALGVAPEEGKPGVAGLPSTLLAGIGIGVVVAIAAVAVYFLKVRKS